MSDANNDTLSDNLMKMIRSDAPDTYNFIRSLEEKRNTMQNYAELEKEK
jgi:hypothetical protein